ncbi:hypothetical protein ABG067_002071 [Albugo candida]|uniref:Uncharacterized protein n=1 Tax=Albugo candida TaxID=65357 RepID=A0A024GW05_9STRA|nr:unnamed protein product [Albugo candida]|eukprot:CCI50810.1 unnamed protein product [Albugo candida]
MNGYDPIEDQTNLQERSIKDLIYRLANPIKFTALVSTRNVADKSSDTFKEPDLISHDSGIDHGVLYRNRTFPTEYDDAVDEESNYHQARIDNLISHLMEPKRAQLPDNASTRYLLSASPMHSKQEGVSIPLCIFFIVALISVFVIAKQRGKGMTDLDDPSDDKEYSRKDFAYHTLER